MRREIYSIRRAAEKFEKFVQGESTFERLSFAKFLEISRVGKNLFSVANILREQRSGAEVAPQFQCSDRQRRNGTQFFFETRSSPERSAFLTLEFNYFRHGGERPLATGENGE